MGMALGAVNILSSFPAIDQMDRFYKISQLDAKHATPLGGIGGGSKDFGP